MKTAFPVPDYGRASLMQAYEVIAYLVVNSNNLILVFPLAL
ncbi:hypothetical protein M3I01_005875 [Marinomonas sp. RSW2]|uniref:Uncharacterized protein n=1 Tax=Marinomonas maritima TaxID=2940935 RepID=A0ABT5WCQ1_9GAMM|nr:hypothetical protein [Marinomonas maritima]MDE8602462.1 hypothetical protein [Marinomonas maritima]